MTSVEQPSTLRDLYDELVEAQLWRTSAVLQSSDSEIRAASQQATLAARDIAARIRFDGHTFTDSRGDRIPEELAQDLAMLHQDEELADHSNRLSWAVTSAALAGSARRVNEGIQDLDPRDAALLQIDTIAAFAIAEASTRGYSGTGLDIPDQYRPTSETALSAADWLEAMRHQSNPDAEIAAARIELGAGIAEMMDRLGPALDTSSRFVMGNSFNTGDTRAANGLRLIGLHRIRNDLETAGLLTGVEPFLATVMEHTRADTRIKSNLDQVGSALNLPGLTGLEGPRIGL